MDPSHLRTWKQWFRLVYFVSSRALSSVEIWGRDPMYKQDKSGDAQVQAGGEGRVEALGLSPSFLLPKNPKAAPCHTWDSGSQPWLHIRVTWAALKAQTCKPHPMNCPCLAAEEQVLLCFPWLFFPLLRAHTGFSVWVSLCHRTVLREHSTQSQKEQSSNSNFTTF